MAKAFTRADNLRERLKRAKVNASLLAFQLREKRNEIAWLAEELEKAEAAETSEAITDHEAGNDRLQPARAGRVPRRPRPEHRR